MVVFIVFWSLFYTFASIVAALRLSLYSSLPEATVLIFTSCLAFTLYYLCVVEKPGVAVLASIVLVFRLACISEIEFTFLG